MFPSLAFFRNYFLSPNPEFTGVQVTSYVFESSQQAREKFNGNHGGNRCEADPYSLQ